MSLSMLAASKRSYYRLAAIAIVLLACGLRAGTLAGRSLWFDEAWAYWVATAPLDGLLEAVKTTLRDPPLHSLLIHFWIYLGRDEFWLRIPSLWSSIAGLLGVMTLTRLAFGKKAALAAALLVALSALDIRYAQEARPYMLMFSLLSWNLVFLWQLLRHDRWWWALLWGGSAVLALYSFYGPGLTIAATALVSVVYAGVRRRWGILLKLAVAGATSVLLTLPLALDWLPAQVMQIPGTEPRLPVLGPFGAELQAFALTTVGLLRYQLMTHQFAGWPWPQVPEWLVWLPLLLLLAACVVRYRLHMLVVWLIATVAVYYAVGKVGAYPYGERYSLILTPLLWSCVAGGFAALWLRQKAVAGLLLAALLAATVLAPPEPQQDLRTITHAWLDARTADTPTYVYYGAAPGLRYQLERLDAVAPAAGVWFAACWQGKPAAVCAEDNVRYGRWIRNFTAERKRESIVATLGGEPQRFWIVFSHVRPGEDEEILAALGDNYSVTSRIQAENAAAILLERR